MLLDLAKEAPIPDPRLVTRALLAADPLARIDIDPRTGRMQIFGRLSAVQAISALDGVGIAAVRPDHVSGTSTCCGSCS